MSIRRIASMVRLLRCAGPAGIRLPAGFRRDDGAAAVEFAIVAPVFLVLLFGIVVYGIYFATWIAVTEAASEGARAAVAGLSTSERVSLATTQVKKFLGYYSPLLNSNNATIVAQQAPGSNGGAFQVQITYDFSSYGLGGLAAFLPIPTANPSVTITVSNGGEL